MLENALHNALGREIIAGSLRVTYPSGRAEAYGDGVDPRWRHQDMWAVKGHYFTAYYNWPYTFGLLFGIGLYAEFQRDPDRFRAGYDDLLSATGLGDAFPLRPHHLGAAGGHRPERGRLQRADRLATRRVQHVERPLHKSRDADVDGVHRSRRLRGRRRSHP